MRILDKQQKMIDKISKKFNAVDDRKEELISKHIEYLFSEADLDLLLSNIDNPSCEDLKLKKGLSAKTDEIRAVIREEYPDLELGDAEFIIKSLRISMNDIDGTFSSPEYDKFIELQDKHEREVLGML